MLFQEVSPGQFPLLVQDPCFSPASCEKEEAWFKAIFWIVITLAAVVVPILVPLIAAVLAVLAVLTLAVLAALAVLTLAVLAALAVLTLVVGAVVVIVQILYWLALPVTWLPLSILFYWASCRTEWENMLTLLFVPILIFNC